MEWCQAMPEIGDMVFYPHGGLTRKRYQALGEEHGKEHVFLDAPGDSPSLVTCCLEQHPYSDDIFI